jgi:hypothetical protein
MRIRIVFSSDFGLRVHEIKKPPGIPGENKVAGCDVPYLDSFCSFVRAQNPYPMIWERSAAFQGATQKKRNSLRAARICACGRRWLRLNRDGEQIEPRASPLDRLGDSIEPVLRARPGSIISE